MAEESNGQSVDISTKWGGLKLSGRDSVLTFLFILLLVLGGLMMWERSQSNMEHQKVMCAIKLNLFMQTIPANSTIEWAKVPVDLYGCIPKFLYERPAAR